MTKTFEIEAMIRCIVHIDEQVLARGDDTTMPYGAMSERELLEHLLWNVVGRID